MKIHTSQKNRRCFWKAKPLENILFSRGFAWLPKRACSHLGIVATTCINPQVAEATCSRVFLRSERPHSSSRNRKSQVRLSARASSCLLSIGCSWFEQKNRKLCSGLRTTVRGWSLRDNIICTTANFCCLLWQTAVVRRHMKETKKKPRNESLVSFLAPPAGLEPATIWLTVRCSTDWAKEEYWV